MKKLAIIGASYLQRPLVEQARAMGLETHVFAWRKGEVVSDIATRFYPISILEKEQILEQCKLYQLCRARLSQENTLFLPLPFSFLEQGYLLAERENREDENDEETDQPWKITLNVQLTSLGNLQILLLFEKQDLRLRILADSQTTQQFLSESLSGLQDTLAGFTLRSYSVGLGAEDPMKALVERLVPHGEHFLDAKA